MVKISEDYRENVAHFTQKLRAGENFDIIKKVLKIADGEVTLFYVDGLIKDGAMQKLFIYLLSLQKMPPTATDFLQQNMPYVECDVAENEELMLRALLDFSNQIGNGDTILYLVPCTREYLKMIKQNRELLESRFVIALPNVQAREEGTEGGARI